MERRFQPCRPDVVWLSLTPAEGLNSIIKKLKRVAAGFKRFDHYRTRILLAIGGVNWNLLLNPAQL